MDLVTVENNGQELVSTNYWDTPHAKKGLMFLSPNAGCLRLLVPFSAESYIPEMKTGKIVIVSKGFWPERNGPGVEVMFEDYTNSPFALHLSQEQFQMIPVDSRKWIMAVWTQAGKVFEKKCKVRTVKTIPCLQPWK